MQGPVRPWWKQHGSRVTARLAPRKRLLAPCACSAEPTPPPLRGGPGGARRDRAPGSRSTAEDHGTHGGIRAMAPPPRPRRACARARAHGRLGLHDPLGFGERDILARGLSAPSTDEELARSPRRPGSSGTPTQSEAAAARAVELAVSSSMTRSPTSRLATSFSPSLLKPALDPIHQPLHGVHGEIGRFSQAFCTAVTSFSRCSPHGARPA